MDLKSAKAQTLLKIIHLLLPGKGMTRQELAKNLGISMPTVLHSIEDLQKAGILKEAGEQASTGGRRAKVLVLDGSCGYGVGIQIARRFVEFALTDMTGQVLARRQLDHPFRDQAAWYRKLGALLLDFITKEQVDGRKIIGVGISFPGIIDQENHMLLHSHVFDLKNVSLDRFYRCIPYPLLISNDANCACRAEGSREEDSYFYISLNESVGGALMVKNNLYKGRRWQAGEIGHMILHPGGRTCYCGKKGCADPYLTAELLMEDPAGEPEVRKTDMEGESEAWKSNQALEPGTRKTDMEGESEARKTDQTGENDREKLQRFFKRLKERDGRACRTWETYMNDLAILVSNVRMLLDMNIVIGGDVGACMEDYMEDLADLTADYDLFSRDVDYISVCHCRDHIFSKGAAVQALESYYDSLVEKL